MSAHAIYHDDGVIIAMYRASPGADDLISHTVRHFIAEGAEMDRLTPREALSANAARWRLSDKGAPDHMLAGIPAGHDRFTRDWWEQPWSALVEGIHDEGYMPRYLEAARRTPLPGRRGSAWKREGGGWRAEVWDPDGVEACLRASWAHHEGRLYMRSALARRAPRRSAPPDDYFKQLLRSLR